MTPQSSKPGKGLMGWLGRQVGYVRRAVKMDVGHKRVYRHESVQEQPLPQQPDITLRRTIVDEAIIKRKA